MQPTTNYLITASRIAAKFLQRDFFELELLQNSSRGTQEFCNNSYLRTKDFLKEELQKHAQFLFFSDEQLSFNNDATIAILINPIEGMQNLAKSIPFFAINITYLKKSPQGFVPFFSVINFPALNEIYYAEKGAGVWSEGKVNTNITRLRISSNNSVDQAIVATDDIATGLKISKNIRLFGSECYHLIMFAAGKCDIFYSSTTDYSLKTASSLIIRESGGVSTSVNQGVLASNHELIDKIKQRIIPLV